MSFLLCVEEVSSSVLSNETLFNGIVTIFASILGGIFALIIVKFQINHELKEITKSREEEKINLKKAFVLELKRLKSEFGHIQKNKTLADPIAKSLDIDVFQSNKLLIISLLSTEAYEKLFKIITIIVEAKIGLSDLGKIDITSVVNKLDEVIEDLN